VADFGGLWVETGAVALACAVARIAGSGGGDRSSGGLDEKGSERLCVVNLTLLMNIFGFKLSTGSA
jgi:hypothetical protein